MTEQELYAELRAAILAEDAATRVEAQDKTAQATAVRRLAARNVGDAWVRLRCSILGTGYFEAPSSADKPRPAAE